MADEPESYRHSKTESQHDTSNNGSTARPQGEVCIIVRGCGKDEVAVEYQLTHSILSETVAYPNMMAPADAIAAALQNHLV